MLNKWSFKRRDTLSEKMNTLTKESLQDDPFLEDILLKIEEQAKKGRFNLNYPIKGIECEAIIKFLKQEGFL